MNSVSILSLMNERSSLGVDECCMCMYVRMYVYWQREPGIDEAADCRKATSRLVHHVSV